MRIVWTPENLDTAERIARSSRTVVEACQKISDELGFYASYDAVSGALARHKRPNMASILGKDIPWSDKVRPIAKASTRLPPPSPLPMAFEDTTDVDIPVYVESEAEIVDAMIAKLVALTKTKHVDFESACDALDASPRRLREVLSEAEKRGYTIALEGGKIGRKPSRERESDTMMVPIQVANERRIFAVASDIHVGSKFFLRDQFVHFVHLAYERGVRVILVPGDILDGVYKHSQWEEYAHGFDEQAEDAARVFPRLDGLRYIGICGNHDETFEKDSGMNISQALMDVFRRAGRDDLTLLGSRGGSVRLANTEDERGLIVEMWHPLGGGAYALSYKLQRKIESYPVGAKPDVVLAGHWHQQVYFTQRGIHAMSCGTWHGGKSPFGRALGTSPAIGGWIIEYAQTPDGTVRHFRPEWIAFYEHEHVRSAPI